MAYNFHHVWPARFLGNKFTGLIQLTICNDALPLAKQVGKYAVELHRNPLLVIG